MANVFDVAKYILHQKGEMSTWKLQKLCYYSQAWALAWTGRPLFYDEFEAWRNGPVCRKLFNAHKGYFSIDEDKLKDGDYTKLSDDELDTIDVVLKDYGDMEPYELSELAHHEDPWRDARGGLPWDANCDTVIEKAAMNNYYGGL